jgi:peptidoglycan/LPS O-acetylase OafA/YrhL
VLHRLLLHGDPEIRDVKGVATTALALVMTLAIAKVSWRYFEGPLVKRGHRYTYGRTPTLENGGVGGFAG